MLDEHTLPIVTSEDRAIDQLAQGSHASDPGSGSQSPGSDNLLPYTDGAPQQDSAASSERFGTHLEDLRWIDPFVEQIRPYVRVRLEDGVLIKMPMEVFQLNRTGLQLLQQTLQGRSIVDVATELGGAESAERIYQVHTFFCDLRDLLRQRLGDGRGRPTTHVEPFSGSFTRYPVLSEIAVTYRCNLACSFCYAGCGTVDASPGNPGRERHRRDWRQWLAWLWPLRRNSLRRNSPRRNSPRDPLRQEMSADEVRQVIDQLARDGKVPSVSFTGGECTLRPELPQFIAHARHRGMRVNIITNGIVCSSRSYVDSLVAAGLTSAQVSLSGPTAAVHDSLAQRPGAFEKAVQGIRNLKDAGLHVHTNTTICEENILLLREIIDLARSLDLPHVSMNQIIPTGTPMLPRHERLKVSYSRIGQYVLQAKEHADSVGIDFHWYSPTPFCIFNPIAHGLGNKGCAACDGLIHVSPAGEVLPCSSFARGVGNLLEHGFEQVWFGADAQYYKHKRAAHSICRRCEHFALCQGACTLYWSGMGYSELHEARRGRA